MHTRDDGFGTLEENSPRPQPDSFGQSTVKSRRATLLQQLGHKNCCTCFLLQCVALQNLLPHTRDRLMIFVHDFYRQLTTAKFPRLSFYHPPVTVAQYRLIRGYYLDWHAGRVFGDHCRGDFYDQESRSKHPMLFSRATIRLYPHLREVSRARVAQLFIDVCTRE